MNKSKSIIAIAVLILSAAAYSGPGVLNYSGLQNNSTFKPFTFAAMGDSRGDSNAVQIDAKVLAGLTDDCSKREPNAAFMVFTGDMIQGSHDMQTLRRGFNKWLALMDSHYNHPVFAVAGNHEIETGESQEICKETFFSQTPQNGPADEKGLSYYFDYNNCRFIFIDTDYYGDENRVRHLEWVQKVLEDANSSHKSYIFVVTHVPAYPVSRHLGDSLPRAGQVIATGSRKSLEELYSFWAMLRKFRVTAYICGHEHLYSRQNVKGVWQIITGGAGAPLYPLNPPYPAADANAKTWLGYYRIAPYYEVLGYPHGRGDIPQAGRDFVGLSVYNYIIVDVMPSKITVRAYGCKPDLSGGVRINAIDTFDIVQ
jgi:3',5'-cyclic AMP phosphodiesterase CpdA